MGGAPYCRVKRPDRYMLLFRHRQRGAIAVMTVVLLFVIFGFFGLALDIARIYNRKIEMQNVADMIALSAAAELNGTEDGITKALGQASKRLSPLGTPGSLTYQYGTQAMVWSNAAMKFSSTLSENATWIDSTSAANNPGQVRYVRVDTSKLNTGYGIVPTLFMHILSSELVQANIKASAIAGPSSVAVTPLAICAMRTDPARDRSGELVEYGFRRGVAYNLMDLNSEVSTSPTSFVINPLAGPGVVGSMPSNDLEKVKPFICTGTMAMSRVTGGNITVESPFPLPQLFTQLNSRFETTGAPCNAYTAPPDANIRPYYFNNNGTLPLSAGVPWMGAVPSGQGALRYPDNSAQKLWTVADPEPTPSGTTGPSFGPLWSYAKAVKYAASEPATGYTAYLPSQWSALYSPGQPQAATTYPSTTPYAAASGAFFQAPNSHKGVRGRRVLNVALLACPAASGAAQVLAIGKFFMTVPATSSTLWGEFAGVAPEASFNGQAELHP